MVVTQRPQAGDTSPGGLPNCKRGVSGPEPKMEDSQNQEIQKLTVDLKPVAPIQPPPHSLQEMK